MAYRILTIAVALMLFVAIVVPSVGESISLNLGSFAPVIEPARYSLSSAADRLNTQRVSLAGCSSFASSGDPALPCRLMYVAVPPSVDERSVKASLINTNMSELPGDYDIQPVPPALAPDGTESWGGGKRIANGRNQLVYTVDSFYPSDHIRVRSIGNLRTWRILEIEIWPCRYNPVSGKLRVMVSGDVTINYATTASSQVSPNDPAAADMAGFVSNPEQAREFYLTSSQPAQSVADYAIITTSAIASSSTKLGAFVSYRQSKGYRVKVVTEAEWGGGTGDRAANNIRQWLRNNYLALGLRYALLIGDPSPSNGSVPMKLFWPRRNMPDYRDAPSDYYYADLTGNWDLDNDGYYGEEPDDFGPGGIDRIPELYVGRIPFYGSITDLDRILQKTMDYESGTLGDWSRNFLLPMKSLDAETPSHILGEQIAQDIARPLSINPRRVYDPAYSVSPPAERTPCDIATVLSEWQTNGAGIVTWMTHGFNTGAMGVFASDNCAFLDDTKPAFVFCASCDNGWPEDSRNLGYSLLKQGAVCTVSASRASFYYPGDAYKDNDTIGGMGYEYARYLLEREQACGGALYDSRTRLPLSLWPNHLLFNVYGDPALCFNASAFGTVCGRVIDSQGVPVPNATISTPDGHKQARSASDGSYTINGMGVASLDLTASAPGYYSQRYYDLPISRGISVPLDFRLQSTDSGSISGYIRSDSGTPVSGATISVVGASITSGSLDNGSFLISDLEPGLYSLLISKSPYAQQQISDCLVNEGQTSAVDITLHVHNGNLLANSSFESGFLQYLAYGWDRYSVPTGYGGLLTGYDQRYSGSYSQKLTLPQPTVTDSRIGVLQTISALPGWTYTLCAHQRDYISAKETNPADNVICRLGYDATGGVDPSAPNIVWREFNPTHNAWNELTAAVTTSSGAVSIFLEGMRHRTSGGNSCYAWFDAVSFTGPLEAPSVPLVTVNAHYVAPAQPINVSWSSSSSTLSYEYAVAASPDGAGMVPGGEWRSAGVGDSVSITGLNLRNGDLVYVLVRAVGDGIVSEPGASEAIRVVDTVSSIPAAKRLPDGAWVRLDDVIISRMGDTGECFAQSVGGAAGIEITGIPWRIPLMTPGTKASVAGCLASQGDMRIIADAEIMPSIIKPAPRPFGMSNCRVGGGDYHYSAAPPVSGQKGSSWGGGLNNVGLLVAVWGRVRSSSSRSFIIDDGTLPHGLPITCLGSARPPQGTPYVRITGIAGPRGVFVCSENDIVELP